MGIPGDEGPVGPTGSTGPTGTPSTVTGPTGTQIYSGTGAPTGTLGRSGDFYIDLLPGVFYGPKA